ncbi:MAG: hypothetical protein BGN83_01115 [Rhizobium sp. 63-7]|nr:MAG: hypothetical protein BGN83_01115 [Rhizobium sp. 63-7]
MLKSLVTEILGSPVASQPAAESLQPFRGLNRVLLIFSDRDNAAAARQENLVLAERDGLAERDMIVLRIRGSAVQPLFGSPPPLDAERLRRDMDVVDGEFCTVLVGKDGTSELRGGKPVSAGEIFTLIDAMLDQEAAALSAAGMKR